MNRICGMTSSKAAVAALLCCVSVLVTGCSTSQFANSDTTPVAGAAIRGVAYGGNQPIIGASVQLWAVGTGGYGSAATKLGSAVSSQSPGGTFTIGAYTCPTGTTQVYLTASGGNPGLSAANPNIMLAAALGNCSSAAGLPFVDMNEVTTAATAFALGQYFTTAVGGPSSGDSFGAPALTDTQAQAGVANAMLTVNNLVNIATGNAVTSVNLPSTVSGAITAWSITSNVATFTAANSLAAGDLVALSGFGTSTFFNGQAVTVLSTGLSSTQFEANVTTHANGSATEAGAFSTGSVTATPESTKLYTIADILASCVNSAGGPTGCGTLFADVTPTGGTAPTDTLQAAVYMSLNPTSNNASGSPANLTALFGLASSSPPFTGVSTQPTDWTVGIQYTSSTALSFPQNLAIDAGGNVWIINANSKTDSLAELGPTGSPEVIAAATTTQQYRSDAIDTNGNVWFATASSPSTTFEYKTSGTLASSTGYSSPYAIAINGNNDVYVGRNSSTACTSSTNAVGEWTADTLAGTNQVGYLCPSLSAFTYAYMAVDASNNLWITNASGSGGSTSITEVPSMPSDATLGTDCTGTTPFPCTSSNGAPPLTYTTITASGGIPTLATPFGVAVGAGGSNIWLANSTGNTLTELTSATAGTNFGDTTSVTKPVFLAVDGAGNIWASDNMTTSPASVSEFSSTGAVLSQVSGNGAVGYSHAGLVSSYGIGVDPSGNIWVANNTATGGVFEIVGAAAPTVTPIALALKNGTVGAKP